VQVAEKVAGGGLPEEWEDIREIKLFSKSVGKETWKKYKPYLKTYMKTMGLTVNDLISEKDPKKVEDQLINFIIRMAEHGKSWGAINNYKSCMLKFYKMNDVDNLRIWKINQIMPEQRKVRKDRAYTYEEIAKMLEVCDERERVIVLLFASTGMRKGGIPELKFRNLKKMENDIYKVTVYEGAKEEYFTFTTPECSKAIDDYVKLRIKRGEKIEDDSFLIREQFNKRIQLAIAHCRGITVDAIKSIMEDITERSNTRSKNVPLCHGFRYFFTKQAVNSKVQYEARMKMEGHSLGITDSYWKTPDREPEIFKEYQKAVNNLTINEENRLKLKVQSLEDKNNEIQNLEKQLNANTATLKRFEDLAEWGFAYGQNRFDKKTDDEERRRLVDIITDIMDKELKSRK